MRARIDQDVFGCSVQRQELDHVAHAAALVRARIKLAVAVGTGATFAEAVVAVAIDLAALVQAFEIEAPRLDELAAIHHHDR